MVVIFILYFVSLCVRNQSSCVAAHSKSDKRNNVKTLYKHHLKLFQRDRGLVSPVLYYSQAILNHISLNVLVFGHRHTE